MLQNHVPLNQEEKSPSLTKGESRSHHNSREEQDIEFESTWVTFCAWENKNWHDFEGQREHFSILRGQCFSNGGANSASLCWICRGKHSVLYSTVQLQVYKRVRANHMECKVTHKYRTCTRASMRHSELLTLGLASLEHINTTVYSLSKSQVLAIELASTHNHLVSNS